MEKKAIAHFRNVDPKLHAAWKEIKHLGPIDPLGEKYHLDYFASLCRIIVGQQLSGHAARSIWKRFDEYYRKNVTPRKVRATKEGALREIGMSWAKVRSLHDLSEKVTVKELVLKDIDTHSDEIVREKLLIVRGIGPWTAEMFLMFSLGRPDVFSYGDLGLQKGVQKIYGLKQKPTEQKLDRLTTKWSPYKTYAAQILWRHVDNTF